MSELTKEEQERYEELNAHGKDNLNAEQRKEYKDLKSRREKLEVTEPEVVVPKDTLHQLVKIVAILAKCSAPVLFKYLSAADVAQSDWAKMQSDIKSLNENLNGQLI